MFAAHLSPVIERTEDPAFSDFRPYRSCCKAHASRAAVKELKTAGMKEAPRILTVQVLHGAPTADTPSLPQCCHAMFQRNVVLALRNDKGVLKLDRWGQLLCLLAPPVARLSLRRLICSSAAAPKLTRVSQIPSAGIRACRAFPRGYYGSAHCGSARSLRGCLTWEMVAGLTSSLKA